MKFKVKGYVAAIYGIVLAAFTAIMALVWDNKDFVFWCFYISTVLILANLFLLHGCMAGEDNRKAAIVNLSLFIPPAVSYVAVCGATWMSSVRDGGTYHALLAADIAIFAVSAIVQICLFHAKRKLAEQ